MPTVEEIQEYQTDSLLTALKRPGMALWLDDPRSAEWMLWTMITDLAFFKDQRDSLREVEVRRRKWMGVGGAPALPINVAWEDFVKAPPLSRAMVAALFVGLAAEMEFVDAKIHDIGPGDKKDLRRGHLSWASLLARFKAHPWIVGPTNRPDFAGFRVGVHQSEWVWAGRSSPESDLQILLVPAATLRASVRR